MMPAVDVSRSDSNRSDASQKPRVSFNRDVHVKRIVPHQSERASGAVNGTDAGTPVTSPVRRERIKKSKKELAEEAAEVIRQADKVQCVVNSSTSPDKFYSLPHRKKSKLVAKEYPAGSLDRRSIKRRGSLDSQPPKKPPRTFAATSSKPSIFELFKKPDKKAEPKKSSLRRSVSDASALKHKVVRSPDELRRTGKRSATDNEDLGRRSITKKQLSPIIEVAQREDYFVNEAEGEPNKENTNTNIQNKTTDNITDQLKDYIDEVDAQLYEETGIRITASNPKKDPPTPVIIDLDKAEKISDGKKSKLHFGLGKKLRQLTGKKAKLDETPDKQSGKNNEKTIDSGIAEEEKVNRESTEKETVTVDEETAQSGEIDPNMMIHSSQKPVDKLPLTKGRTVNTMVKRLSNDSCSSPPPMRTHVLISPHVSMQHNNNQPFSYTRGISPDKCLSNENLAPKPVIYAQVVCSNNDNGLSNGKQTVHTTLTNGRRQPQSDSDEGLGGEEGSAFTRKSSTHFNDDSFDSYTEQLLDEIDKYKAESPILPKYRNPMPMNGFTGLAERGRADGMDAKRRESFTEPNNERRTDLATRRDLLESRMNRRMSDKTATPSPEHPITRPGANNVYITETSSRYYRSGSTSPVGFKEKYVSTSRTDKYGERKTESRTKKYFGEPQDLMLNGFESEPKSFDSHISDYRSYRPEKPLSKDRDIYKSTPEIRHLERRNVDQVFHGSLPRGDKIQSHHNSSRRFRSERHLDRVEEDRKVESSTTSRTSRSRRDVYNDSEDEGFASSLLIASEKQHTDDSLARKHRKDRDFDRSYKDEESYRPDENTRYIPRERSIDDGSHFDPRLDKDLERSTLKRVEKKPPKAEKKSGLEKVKSLFMRDSKKKKEKAAAKETKSKLSSYKGRDESKDERDSKVNSSSDYRNRRRLSTPSPSPTRENPKKSSDLTQSGWFKSLDRTTQRKSAKDEGNYTSTEEETIVPQSKLSASNKNLRFFGDTDQESNGDSLRGSRPIKTRPGLRAQSTRDLHNIDEVQKPSKRSDTISHHKSLTNISECDRDFKGSRSTLKPPVSPSARYRREERPRRRRQEISSVESSTEGDSSQQSQRSIVYLHAATVGDIPGPDYLRNGRRAASREDLTSNGGSSLVQPQVKTLSRSFSVLAPWRPRHRREGMELDYTVPPPSSTTSRSTRGGKYEQRSSRSSTQRNDGSTLKKKAQEGKKASNNRLTRSRENLSSREETIRGSTSTLYKKKEKLPRENSRYKDREERRMPPKSQSVESISRRSKEDSRDVSRSVSMPRDSAKAAGWFRKSKKTRD
ncbi:bloated isoform X2 [Rhynchophorus ferrugineus]|uniref:bloated isoform X2 n=1 Tax=Rhynchophorus ferrugineus TaxID=354439 RepID=UPI003FCD9C46